MTVLQSRYLWSSDYLCGHVYGTGHLRPRLSFVPAVTSSHRGLCQDEYLRSRHQVVAIQKCVKNQVGCRLSQAPVRTVGMGIKKRF